jgi:hypothetical protein
LSTVYPNPPSSIHLSCIPFFCFLPHTVTSSQCASVASCC